jgi:endoglucanase
MKTHLKTLILAVLAATALYAQSDPLNMTTMQAVKDMGLGINLGNTMEATIVCDNGDAGCENWVSGMETLETSWGSPKITNDIIRGYANAGFKTVRIPVAWSNKMTGNNNGGTYTISPALMDRVEEIVDMVLNNGMYAIVNIHWDGGWWENFPNDSANCMNKYKKIWEQISERFKNHNGHLIFASMNEEGVWNDVWNQYGSSTTGKSRAYGLLFAINQQFVDVVRSSGGSNVNRHLQVQGYATNIDLTTDPEFKMPKDSHEPSRLAVSVHYYDPFGFTHLTEDSDWGEPLRLTWGTDDERNYLNVQMDKLKTTFVDDGIPVIIGEYGFASTLPRDTAEVRKYTLAVTEAILERNMLPILWDVQLNESNGEVIYYYNRNTKTFGDQELIASLKELARIYSSGDGTPIRAKNILQLQYHFVTYYNIKGKPLGTAKPLNPGVYIEKSGKQVRKIVVK